MSDVAATLGVRARGRPVRTGVEELAHRDAIEFGAFRVASMIEGLFWCHGSSGLFDPLNGRFVRCSLKRVKTSTNDIRQVDCSTGRVRNLTARSACVVEDTDGI